MANSIGWLKLHRELLEKPIWVNSTPQQKSILIAILCMVNHEPNKWEWKGKLYEINAGQTITSIDKICLIAGKGISSQNVRTAINRFEKLGFLTNESANDGRLLTVLNWRIYQSEEIVTNKRTNRQLTGNQQTTNKPLTPIEEIKNDKEVKNTIPSELNTPDFCETWNNWINYRNEIKKPLKASTINQQLKRFKGEGIRRSIEAMNLSMENGWQGLFWDKIKSPIEPKDNYSVGEDPDELAYITALEERIENENKGA